MAIDDPFDYATGATGSDAPARPSDSEISAGLAAGQTLPSSLWNWALSILGGLTRSGKVFDTLESAVDELAAGESGIVHEDDDGTAQPGAAKLRMSPTTLATTPSQDSVSCVATDGRNVAFGTKKAGSAAKIFLFARGDLTTGGTALLSLVPSTTDTVTEVLYDGTYLVAAYGAVVRCYDASDGSVLWTFTHGGTVHDIAMDGTNVYFAGVDASSVAAGAIALSSSGTASAAWTYNHGADLYAVCTDGARVFVGGDASSGTTIQVLTVAGSTSGVGTWAVNGTGTPRPRCMRTDGRILVVGNTDGAGVQTIEVRGCSRGHVVASTKLISLDGSTSVDPSGVAVDDQYIHISYSSAGLGGVRTFRRDLTPSYVSVVFDDFGGGTATNPLGALAVVSDGQSVYAGLDTSASTATNQVTTLARYYRGGAGRRWLRVDPANEYLPARQRIIPEGW